MLISSVRSKGRTLWFDHGVLASLITFTAFAPAANAQQFVEQQSTRFPQPALLEYTNQLTVGDLDGDGDLDIVFANGGNFSSAGTPQALRVFINTGLNTGVFADETLARTGGLTFLARGCELGDIERDGDLDIIVAQDFLRQPTLLVNNGSGVFTNETSTRVPIGTLSSSRAQFADVDNDGDLDIYLTVGGANRFGTGRGKLWLNNGSGVFTDATNTNTPNQTVTEPQDCIFGDIDGDFDLDLRIGSTGANQSKLYRNDGTGVFAQVTTPSDQNCYSYDFGDINGDGDLDLVGANANPTSTNAEFTLDNSDGLGTYLAGSFVGSAVDDNDSKFFDVDNDGDFDIVIASLSTTERIYLNNGTGTFTLGVSMITAISDASLDVKVADFNGDGRYDIVTAQGESGSFINRIYMNTGPVDTRPPNIARTEQLPNTALVGPFPVRVEIYDAHTSDRGFHDKGITLNWRNVPAGAIAGGKEGAFAQVPMLWSGNSLWRGVIPAQTTSGTVEYYVTAVDFAGNVGTGPTRSFVITLPGCPADTDNSGAVDVDDLIAVILGWGCTTPPGPCAADVDDSGVVDVDDLIAVILGWGPCG